MTLDSSVRSRGVIPHYFTRAAEPTLRALGSRGVAVEKSSLDPVLLARRSLGSHARRNVILASVFGTVGCIALILSVYLAFRYWTRRRVYAEDMVIERPNHHHFQDSQEKPVYQNPPPPPARPPYTPDHAYIPNHPYAVSYSRNPPPTPNQPTMPTTSGSSSRPNPPPLAPLAMPTSHPFARNNESHQRREPSMDPASTIYESFMSPDSLAPTPEPGMEPSPLASTAGGAIINPSHYEPSHSEDTAMSSGSRSSSAPLQAHKHPYRQ